MKGALGSVWHNPERWEKDKLKHILTHKLQDVFIQQYRAHLNDESYPNAELQNVFIQQYRAYLKDESNSDKCLLAKMCDKGVYNVLTVIDLIWVSGPRSRARSPHPTALGCLALDRGPLTHIRSITCLLYSYDVLYLHFKLIHIDSLYLVGLKRLKAEKQFTVSIGLGG